MHTTVANSATMSGGVVVVKVKLQQDDENPQSSHGLLDHDLVQYYRFLADKGDVTAQVIIIFKQNF